MDLNKLYDIVCKTLTVTREEFINKKEYEQLRNKTINRYQTLQQIKKDLSVRRKSNLFEKCIKEEFGLFNYNEQNEYKYFIKRL